MPDNFDGIENIPAVMLSIDHQIGEGRIIRFSTGIARDATPGEFNVLLDKLTLATDRQAAKYQLQQLRETLVREEKMFTQQTEDLVRIDAEWQAGYEQSNRRGPWGPEKLTGAQRKDRENVELSLSRRRDMIIGIRDQIKKTEAIIHAADGSANSH